MSYFLWSTLSSICLLVVVVSGFRSPGAAKVVRPLLKGKDLPEPGLTKSRKETQTPAGARRVEGDDPKLPGRAQHSEKQPEARGRKKEKVDWDALETDVGDLGMEARLSWTVLMDGSGAEKLGNIKDAQQARADNESITSSHSWAVPADEPEAQMMKHAKDFVSQSTSKSNARVKNEIAEKWSSQQTNLGQDGVEGAPKVPRKDGFNDTRISLSLAVGVIVRATKSIQWSRGLDGSLLPEVPKGTLGTIKAVDDEGTVPVFFVSWKDVRIPAQWATPSDLDTYIPRVNKMSPDKEGFWVFLEVYELRGSSVLSAFAASGAVSAMVRPRNPVVFLERGTAERSKALYHTEVILCSKKQFPADVNQKFEEFQRKGEPFAEVHTSIWRRDRKIFCEKVCFGGGSGYEDCSGVDRDWTYFQLALPAIPNAEPGSVRKFLYGSTSMNIAYIHKRACLCGASWSAYNYDFALRNCNTFSATVMKFYLGLSDRQPGLGISSISSVVECPQ